MEIEEIPIFNNHIIAINTLKPNQDSEDLNTIVFFLPEKELLVIRLFECLRGEKKSNKYNVLYI